MKLTCLDCVFNNAGYFLCCVLFLAGLPVVIAVVVSVSVLLLLFVLILILIYKSKS